MFKAARFLVTFVASSVTLVGSVWGFLEAYTYFKGEHLKQTLGPYWPVVYGGPVVLALVATVLRELKQMGEKDSHSSSVSGEHVKGKYIAGRDIHIHPTRPESVRIPNGTAATEEYDAKTDEELSRILRIKRKFPRTDRRFEVAAEPQRIVIEFTNIGNDIIHVRGVRYFEKSFGLPSSMLSLSYVEDDYHRVIPFDTSTSDVLRGQKFAVEIHLDAVLKRESIEAKWGDLGYLFIDVAYSGESARLQYDV